MEYNNAYEYAYQTFDYEHGINHTRVETPITTETEKRKLQAVISKEEEEESLRSEDDNAAPDEQHSSNRSYLSKRFSSIGTITYSDGGQTRTSRSNRSDSAEERDQPNETYEKEMGNAMRRSSEKVTSWLNSQTNNEPGPSTRGTDTSGNEVHALNQIMTSINGLMDTIKENDNPISDDEPRPVSPPSPKSDDEDGLVMEEKPSKHHRDPRLRRRRQEKRRESRRKGYILPFLRKFCHKSGHHREREWSRKEHLRHSTALIMQSMVNTLKSIKETSTTSQVVTTAPQQPVQTLNVPPAVKMMVGQTEMAQSVASDPDLQTLTKKSRVLKLCEELMAKDDSFKGAASAIKQSILKDLTGVAGIETPKEISTEQKEPNTKEPSEGILSKEFQKELHERQKKAAKPDVPLSPSEKSMPNLEIDIGEEENKDEESSIDDDAISLDNDGPLLLEDEKPTTLEQQPESKRARSPSICPSDSVSTAELKKKRAQLALELCEDKEPGPLEKLPTPSITSEASNSPKKRKVRRIVTVKPTGVSLRKPDRKTKKLPKTEQKTRKFLKSPVRKAIFDSLFSPPSVERTMKKKPKKKKLPKVYKPPKPKKKVRIKIIKAKKRPKKTKSVSDMLSEKGSMSQTDDGDTSMSSHDSFLSGSPTASSRSRCQSPPAIRRKKKKVKKKSKRQRKKKVVQPIEPKKRDRSTSSSEDPDYLTSKKTKKGKPSSKKRSKTVSKSRQQQNKAKSPPTQERKVNASQSLASSRMSRKDEYNSKIEPPSASFADSDIEIQRTILKENSPQLPFESSQSLVDRFGDNDTLVSSNMSIRTKSASPPPAKKPGTLAEEVYKSQPSEKEEKPVDPVKERKVLLSELKGAVNKIYGDKLYLSGGTRTNHSPPPPSKVENQFEPKLKLLSSVTPTASKDKPYQYDKRTNETSQRRRYWSRSSVHSSRSRSRKRRRSSSTEKTWPDDGDNKRGAASPRQRLFEQNYREHVVHGRNMVERDRKAERPKSRSSRRSRSRSMSTGSSSSRSVSSRSSAREKRIRDRDGGKSKSRSCTPNGGKKPRRSRTPTEGFKRKANENWREWNDWKDRTDYTSNYGDGPRRSAHDSDAGKRRREKKQKRERDVKGSGTKNESRERRKKEKSKWKAVEGVDQTAERKELVGELVKLVQRIRADKNYSDDCVTAETLDQPREKCFKPKFPPLSPVTLKYIKTLEKKEGEANSGSDVEEYEIDTNEILKILQEEPVFLKMNNFFDIETLDDKPASLKKKRQEKKDERKEEGKEDVPAIVEKLLSRMVQNVDLKRREETIKQQKRIDTSTVLLQEKNHLSYSDKEEGNVSTPKHSSPQVPKFRPRQIDIFENIKEPRSGYRGTVKKKSTKKPETSGDKPATSERQSPQNRRERIECILQKQKQRIETELYTFGEEHDAERAPIESKNRSKEGATPGDVWDDVWGEALVVKPVSGIEHKEATSNKNGKKETGKTERPTNGPKKSSESKETVLETKSASSKKKPEKSANGHGHPGPNDKRGAHSQLQNQILFPEFPKPIEAKDANKLTNLPFIPRMAIANPIVFNNKETSDKNIMGPNFFQQIKTSLNFIGEKLDDSKAATSVSAGNEETKGKGSSDKEPNSVTGQTGPALTKNEEHKSANNGSSSIFSRKPALTTQVKKPGTTKVNLKPVPPIAGITRQMPPFKAPDIGCGAGTHTTEEVPPWQKTPFKNLNESHVEARTQQKTSFKGPTGFPVQAGPIKNVKKTTGNVQPLMSLNIGNPALPSPKKVTANKPKFQAPPQRNPANLQNKKRGKADNNQFTKWQAPSDEWLNDTWKEHSIDTRNPTGQPRQRFMRPPQMRGSMNQHFIRAPLRPRMPMNQLVRRLRPPRAMMNQPSRFGFGNPVCYPPVLQQDFQQVSDDWIPPVSNFTNQLKENQQKPLVPYSTEEGDFQKEERQPQLSNAKGLCEAVSAFTSQLHVNNCSTASDSQEKMKPWPPIYKSHFTESPKNYSQIDNLNEQQTDPSFTEDLSSNIQAEMDSQLGSSQNKFTIEHDEETIGHSSLVGLLKTDQNAKNVEDKNSRLFNLE